MRLIKYLIINILIILFAHNIFALNLAVVDINAIQQVLLKDIDKHIASEFKSRHDGINELGHKIAEKQDKLRKEQDILKPDVSHSLRQEVESLQAQYQRKVQAFEEDLNMRRTEEMRPKFEEFTKTIKQYSLDKKYDLVLVKNVALYVSDKFDITKDILKKIDK